MMRLFGRRIRHWRAGPEYRVAEDVRFSAVPRTIQLRSAAFEDGGSSPISKPPPPLTWSGVPPQAQRLVLVMEDVDVPLLRPPPRAPAADLAPAQDPPG